MRTRNVSTCAFGAGAFFGSWTIGASVLGMMVEYGKDMVDWLMFRGNGGSFSVLADIS